MYVPKHFEETDPSILKGVMRQFSFALLVTALTLLIKLAIDVFAPNLFEDI